MEGQMLADVTVGRFNSECSPKASSYRGLGQTLHAVTNLISLLTRDLFPVYRFSFSAEGFRLWQDFLLDMGRSAGFVDFCLMMSAGCVLGLSRRIIGSGSTVRSFRTDAVSSSLQDVVLLSVHLFFRIGLIT